MRMNVASESAQTECVEGNFGSNAVREMNVNPAGEDRTVKVASAGLESVLRTLMRAAKNAFLMSAKSVTKTKNVILVNAGMVYARMEPMIVCFSVGALKSVKCAFAIVSVPRGHALDTNASFQGKNLGAATLNCPVSFRKFHCRTEY